MPGFLPAEPPTPRPLSPLIPKEASESIYFFQLHHHHHHQCASCPHPSPAPNCLPAPNQKLSSSLPVSPPAPSSDSRPPCGWHSSFFQSLQASIIWDLPSLSLHTKPPTFLSPKQASLLPQHHAPPSGLCTCPLCLFPLPRMFFLAQPCHPGLKSNATVPELLSDHFMFPLDPPSPSILLRHLLYLGMVLLPARPDRLSPLVAPHIGPRCKTSTLRTRQSSAEGLQDPRTPGRVLAISWQQQLPGGAGPGKVGNPREITQNRAPQCPCSHDSVA